MHACMQAYVCVCTRNLRALGLTDREPCHHGEAAYARLRLQRKPNMLRDSTKPCASSFLLFRAPSTPPVLMQAVGI